MSTPATKASDTTQYRQQLINDMIEEYGSQWIDQYKPGSFGCHELLDRTALAADLVERYVLSHPACAQNEEWFALADQAVTALQELYQQIGEAHLDERNKTAT